MNTDIQRDVILVIGPSASGKTHVLNLLRREIAETYGLPHEIVPLSDSHTILDRVREDDRLGGRHHYHSWSRDMDSHNHADHPEIIPFTLAGDRIGHAFIRDFFQGLANLPHTGVIRYAEWSGGKNTNPREDRASLTDLSFQTITRLIRQGRIPAEGLDRVVAAIHVDTSREYRMHLNEDRSMPTAAEIKFGYASWPLDQAGMNIFGEDDFLNDTPSLLNEHKIPFIRTLHNNLDGSLDRELRSVLPEIVSQWAGGETGLPASIRDRGRR